MEKRLVTVLIAGFAASATSPPAPAAELQTFANSGSGA